MFDCMFGDHGDDATGIHEPFSLVGRRAVRAHRRRTVPP